MITTLLCIMVALLFVLLWIQFRINKDLVKRIDNIDTQYLHLLLKNNKENNHD